jgi:trimethylguanosine synthase
MRTMMGGLDGCELLRASLRVAPNVCYFLPRNVDRRQATGLAAGAGVPLELERNFLNQREKAVTAYYGFEEAEEEEEEEEEAAEPAGMVERDDPLFD